MRSNLTCLAASAFALCISSTSTAAMTGVCASVKRVGGYTLVDLYATMDAQANLLQFVALRTLTTTAAGGFVQGASPALKGWAPDAGFTSTRDSLDSFLTIGGSQYGDPTGPYYANLSLFPSPWPTGAWIGTPTSAPSNALVSDRTISWSVIGSDTKARGISLAGLEGRMDVQGNGSASTWGVWFAHLVVAGDAPFSVALGTWGATYQNTLNGFGVTYATGAQLSFTVLPAPGALAALAIAGAARSRRRSRPSS